VLLGAIKRLPRRPFVFGGALYAIGYAEAALRRQPRVEREVRAYVRREEARQVLAVLTRRVAVAPTRG
jgi:hypothetical protein